MGVNPNPQEWLSSFITILNNLNREKLGHATFFPFGMNWWESNNEAWNIAFQHGFDYILRLDDDIWDVPQDALSKLLAADKDIIGAAYPARRFPYRVSALNLITKDDNIAETFNSPNTFMQCLQTYAYEGQEPETCDLVGFGMTLIKVSSFKFCERPMYRGVQICPDDSWLAQVCKENGIQQWVHWGVRLKHRHVTFENAGHLFNADLLAYSDTQPKEQIVKDLENGQTSKSEAVA